MHKRLKVFLKISAALTGIGLIIYAGILLFIFVGPSFQEFLGRRSFETKLWKDETASASGIRLTMVEDLLARHPLVGKDKAYINELLGVPPKTEYFRDYDYVYWLGNERGFISIDSEWLVIKFEGGIVVIVKIVRD
jgi:hypothetical protein